LMQRQLKYHSLHIMVKQMVRIFYMFFRYIHKPTLRCKIFLS
jgi:hypothetical protein